LWREVAGSKIETACDFGANEGSIEEQRQKQSSQNIGRSAKREQK